MPSTSNYLAGDDDRDARLVTDLCDSQAGVVGIDDQPLRSVSADSIEVLLDTIDVPLAEHDEGRAGRAAAKAGATS